MEKFKVAMIMESGAFYSWSGKAEDKDHAEGLAIAEATQHGEQVYEVKYTGVKHDDGKMQLCAGY